MQVRHRRVVGHRPRLVIGAIWSLCRRSQSPRHSRVHADSSRSPPQPWRRTFVPLSSSVGSRQRPERMVVAHPPRPNVQSRRTGRRPAGLVKRAFGLLVFERMGQATPRRKTTRSGAATGLEGHRAQLFGMVVVLVRSWLREGQGRRGEEARSSAETSRAAISTADGRREAAQPRSSLAAVPRTPALKSSARSSPSRRGSS